MLDATKNIHKRTGFRQKAVIILFSVSGLIVIALLYGLSYYNTIFDANIDTGSEAEVEIYIPSNPDFEEVVNILRFSGTVKDIDKFIWVAQRKRYPSNTKGGRYILKNRMSNNTLINMLRAGRQAPVNVTFNNIRTFEELAGALAKRLEPDSLQFLTVFRDTATAKYGFEPHTIMAMIIPNTYQMYWTTTPDDFMMRMKQEYTRFWNEARLQKAEAAELSPIEVATLASIVDEETIKNDEKPRVAGLYINRLNKGIRLQADPTIKFALANFAINRVLTRDLKINSSYNTYIHAGLPPGPIRMPSIQGIEAVLNYEKHEYIFMCAKADFSGYHDFAKTLQQHNRNAARYRQELKNKRIYR
jgi:UPF0755 protein